MLQWVAHFKKQGKERMVKVIKFNLFNHKLQNGGYGIGTVLLIFAFILVVFLYVRG
jgi:hypothetical protein